ncbi:MAG: hypothetical protein V3U71_09570 [Cocleimonas sp.]
MKIDVSKCPNCSESLQDLVDKLDDDLEKGHKPPDVFECPYCHAQITFAGKVYAFSLVAVFIIFAILLLVELSCFFIEGRCVSFISGIKTVNWIVSAIMVILVYLFMRTPRLKLASTVENSDRK